MANEIKDIGDIVKKCKILLLDIEGTTTSISFVKHKLFIYAEENVKQFLESQWEKEDVKEAVTALRKLALEDKEGNVEGVVTIPGEDASKEEQIEGLVSSVKWQMSADRKTGALKQLQGLIWKDGYDSGHIQGHVYGDVSSALEQWHSVDGQKVYIYSSGSVQAQKLLFGQSKAGDLLPYIDGHFDTAVGAKQEATSYTNIVEKIGCKADEILFLTDIAEEAEAARAAGLHAALVSRDGNLPLAKAAIDAFPVIHSLAELTVSNKRKPDSQEADVQPAKVPKTTTEDDAKATAPEVVESEATEASANDTEKPEKMEVEEVVATNEEAKVQGKEEVIVEEVTDASEIADVPVTEVEPIVIEEKETKTDEIETEKMETETSKVLEQVEAKPDEATASIADDTPPAVITEVEDISDKQLGDVAEIIEDLEPVVEEPAAVEDIEDLQNVGEVLEKECDEILSKVQDVTNLDNIPMKPLLNTIAEDTMETDNGDTNDIVENILDSELELEMKQCGDIDLNTVTEITDEKSQDGEQSDAAKDQTSPVESTDQVPESKDTENIIEATSVVDEKVEENSTTETKVEEAKVEKQKSEIESKDAVAAESPGTEIAPPAETTEKKVVTEEVKPDTEESKPVAEDSVPAANEINQAEQAAPALEDAKPSTVENKPENDVTETQVNGKETNGNTETTNVNGDASKDDELSSRLSVENGKEVVNGSNGDSNDTEQGQGDSKVEAELSEIKVKTVTTDEPRTDPIEQPTEA